MKQSWNEKRKRKKKVDWWPVGEVRKREVSRAIKERGMEDKRKRN